MNAKLWTFEDGRKNKHKTHDKTDQVIIIILLGIVAVCFLKEDSSFRNKKIIQIHESPKSKKINSHFCQNKRKKTIEILFKYPSYFKIRKMMTTSLSSLTKKVLKIIFIVAVEAEVWTFFHFHSNLLTRPSVKTAQIVRECKRKHFALKKLFALLLAEPVRDLFFVCTFCLSYSSSFNQSLPDLWPAFSRQSTFPWPQKKAQQLSPRPVILPVNNFIMQLWLP